uniref:Uncharacterized protein n=1 Tax=Myoviridae sp. ctVeR24 TaxID=2827689 RepID=A0A8S5SX26_9CAUD|nr:MAG TPA: hypothetical protein [Myoviridae sp. ctVeR24]
MTRSRLVRVEVIIPLLIVNDGRSSLRQQHTNATTHITFQPILPHRTKSLSHHFSQFCAIKLVILQQENYL